MDDFKQKLQQLEAVATQDSDMAWLIGVVKNLQDTVALQDLILKQSAEREQRLNKEIEEWKRAWSDACSDSVQIGIDNEVMTERYDKLKQDNEKLAKLLATSDNVVGSMRQMYFDNRKQLEEAQKELFLFKQNAPELQSDAITLRNKLIQTEAEHADMKQTMLAMRDQRERYCSQVEIAREALEQLAKTKCYCTSYGRCGCGERMIDDACEALAKLDKDMPEREANYERDKLKQQVEDAGLKVREMIYYVTELNQINDKLSAALVGLRTERDALIRDVEVAHAELAYEKERTADLVKMYDRLEETNKDRLKSAALWHKSDILLAKSRLKITRQALIEISQAAATGAVSKEVVHLIALDALKKTEDINKGPCWLCSGSGKCSCIEPPHGCSECNGSGKSGEVK